MKNFLRVSAGLNLVPLALEILSQPHLWKEDTYLRDYPQGPFGDTETIFLRFPPASVTEIERDGRDQHECIWMDGSLHLPSARAWIFALMNQFQGERLGRVMINKLKAGGRVFPHADTPAHAQYWDRFHYVVKGLPGVSFRCGTEEVQMTTGDCWWFQNAIEHEVVNNSADDRIHMIVDIRTHRQLLKGVLPTTPVPA